MGSPGGPGRERPYANNQTALALDSKNHLFTVVGDIGDPLYDLTSQVFWTEPNCADSGWDLTSHDCTATGQAIINPCGHNMDDGSYSRDGKKGKLRIEYGLLTDPEGCPVAVRVFPGNTGDPAAFTAIVDVVRDKFALRDMVMAGDRGMITAARIHALNQLEDGTPRPNPYGWITALRAPAIKKLMAEDWPLQLSLFDQQDLADRVSSRGGS